jgi:tetratricopeptide (TPR) repeat protein
VCGNGRSYCEQGFICARDNTCVSIESGRVCSNLKNYCDQGFVCSRDNECLSRESSRVCSDGRSLCERGSVCTKDNKCLSETTAKQNVDWCVNEGNAFEPGLQISGCTEEIQLSRRSGAALAWAFIGRGNGYYKVKDYDRAIADYSQAIQLDAGDAVGYKNRANVYWAKKDYDRALADYSQAIRLNPNDAQTYRYRGDIYSNDQYDKMDYERAIADYSNSIRLNPDADVLRRRGGAYEKQKDYNRALADYSEAIRRSPNDIDALYARARIYYSEMKDTDRAMADYKEGVRLAAAVPNREPLLLLLDALAKVAIVGIYVDRGDAIYEKKEYERAIAVYNEALSYSPRSWGPLLNRAYAFYQLANYDKAISDYDAVLKELKDDSDFRPTALFGRGVAKLKNGDTTGDADIMTARAIEPNIAAQLVKYNISIDAETLARTKPPSKPLPCQLTEADIQALADATPPLTREQAEALQGNDAKNLCMARPLAGLVRSGRVQDIKSQDYPKDLEKYVSKEELSSLNKIMEGLLAKTFGDMLKKK